MAKVYTDLSEFKPWSGAEDAWDKIVDADMLDEFAALLDVTFPSEGGDHECYIDETELNDMLRFEGEEWLGYLGLSDDNEIEESTRIRGRRVTSSSRRSRGRRVMAARNAKKIEVYVVQEYTGYGNGWEDIAQYPDTSSDSLRQAKQDVKDYRDNGYSARIITRRIDNSDYVEPANEITYHEAVAWVKSCPYDVRESYYSAGKNYVLGHEGESLGFAQIYIDEDNTVRVRNIRGNRTKQVRSIAELEKEVQRLANL